MKRILFDTSVLVPALVKGLERHTRALPQLQRALQGEVEFLVAAHTIAEVHAVLTRLPVAPRIGPTMAHQMLRENVLSRAQVIALTAADYEIVVSRCADLGLAGGVIYDGLIARAAENARADELLTFNAEDFRRVWPAGAGVIREP